MNQKNAKQKMVCFCYSISEQEIVDAIYSKNASSLMDIRRLTYANTGCGGCREDVKRLLNKHVKKRDAENG